MEEGDKIDGSRVHVLYGPVLRFTFKSCMSFVLNIKVCFIPTIISILLAHINIAHKAHNTHTAFNGNTAALLSLVCVNTVFERSLLYLFIYLLLNSLDTPNALLGQCVVSVSRLFNLYGSSVLQTFEQETNRLDFF